MKFHLLWAAAAAAALLSGCGGDTPSSTAPSAQAAATSGVISGRSAQVAAVPRTSFAGKLADYTVVRSAAGVVVTEKAGAKTVVTLAAPHILLFADATVDTDTIGVAGKVYRLYQAALDRVPDAAGLGFHISAMEGLQLPFEVIARGFVDSPEFATRYGPLTNQQYVTQLYRNVLRREPKAFEVQWYVDLLDAKTVSRAIVLTNFSESPENIALVAPAIANGVSYIPYVVPGAGQARAANGATPKVFWRADAPLDVVLHDERGTPVPNGSLTCTSSNPAVLAVASNCRSASGLRLGSYDVTVSGGGVSARVAVQVIPQRVALAAGSMTGFFNAATGANGEVAAWGYNGSKQLGQGGTTTANSDFPLLVRDSSGTGHLGGIVAAAGGQYDMLGLSEDGRVYVWGAKTLPLPVRVRNPADNGDLGSIVQVASGEDNAIALTDDGRVLTWGSYHGQGYSGESKFPNQPRLASGAALTGIVQISAGQNFGIALGEDGRVYGWGWNTAGQTGRGTVTTAEKFVAPVLRASDSAPIDNIVAISAGEHYAMALRADGQVYAWGSNDYNQAAQGSDDIARFSKAVLMKNSTGSAPLGNIAMISAGGIYGLALDDRGRVWSWGHNNNGPLGVGTARRVGWRVLPGPVVGTDGLGQLENIVSIAAGTVNGYALRRDGTVLAWGRNYAGANGTGTVLDADLHVPTPVAGLNNQGKLVLNLAAYPNLLRRGR